MIDSFKIEYKILNYFTNTFCSNIYIINLLIYNKVVHNFLKIIYKTALKLFEK